MIKSLWLIHLNICDEFLQTIFLKPILKLPKNNLSVTHKDPRCKQQSY